MLGNTRTHTSFNSISVFKTHKDSNSKQTVFIQLGADCIMENVRFRCYSRAKIRFEKECLKRIKACRRDKKLMLCF